jgi:hypothetical protein
VELEQQCLTGFPQKSIVEDSDDNEGGKRAFGTNILHIKIAKNEGGKRAFGTNILHIKIAIFKLNCQKCIV